MEHKEDGKYEKRGGRCSLAALPANKTLFFCLKIVLPANQKAAFTPFLSFIYEPNATSAIQ
jgi:hypothetical protein